MAIELKNKITFTKTTTMYGHTGLDADGYPTGAGNGTIKDILDLENADLKDAFSFAVDSSNNRKYILKLFGDAVANFTVPVDKFIKSVSYDESTRELVFVFYKADETEETVRVDISDLVDTYTAGLGLKVSDNEFSAKIKSGEAVLKVGNDGLYTDMSNYDTSTEVSTKVNAHANKKDNPHEVTKTQVGLGNCDNTADIDKPISTATQTALNGKQSNALVTSFTNADNSHYPSAKLVNDNLGTKANQTDLTAHTSNTSNPHSVTKSQVGLGNVLNVAQYSKTEVDTKLSGKSDTSHTHDGRYYTETEIDSKVSALNTSISSEATARANADALKLNIADLLNKVYPVGSIYMSMKTTSPASFIGGTWQRLASRFLYGGSALQEYTTSNQGGEATHTLTIAEMPSHNHTLSAQQSPKQISGGSNSSGDIGYGTYSTDYTGGGGAHNNLPPYQLVNMWFRTA